MFLNKTIVLLLGCSCAYALEKSQVVLDYSCLVEPDIDAAEQVLKAELGLGSATGFFSKWSSRASLVAYLIANGLPLAQSSIQQSFFTFLRMADPSTLETPIIHELDGFPPFPDESTILPPLMCKQWLTRTDCTSIVKQFTTFLQTSKLTTEQQKFYLAVARTAFIAALYAQTSKVNRKAQAFVASCRERGAQVYLIGNINGECYHELKNRLSDPKKPDYCKEFADFDPKHVYFSFIDGHLKPTPTFYAVFKEHCHIDPKKPIFCLESPASRRHIAAAQAHLTPHCHVASQEIFTKILDEISKK